MRTSTIWEVPVQVSSTETCCMSIHKIALIFSKSQCLYTGGEIGIFPNPGAYIEGERWEFFESQGLWRSSEFFQVLGIWRKYEGIWRYMRDIWRKYKEGIMKGVWRKTRFGMAYTSRNLSNGTAGWGNVNQKFLGKPKNTDCLSCFSTWVGEGKRSEFF